MEIPALISLSAVAEYPPSHVGEQAVVLAELMQANIPVVETRVIPTDTLHKLSSEIGLSARLKPLLKDSRWSDDNHHSQLRSEIIEIIRRTELPNWFTKPVLQWYHQQSGFVRAVISAAGYEHLDHSNIKGDANLIDSIVALWAEQAQIDKRTKEFKLFVRPVILQRHTQPIASGRAYSANHQDKHTMVIHSVLGVYQPDHPEIKPDEFVIDVRTNQVVEKHVQPQYVQLERVADGLKEKPVLHYLQTKPSLSTKQAEELAQLVSQTKRLLFHDQQLLWSLENDEFVMTSIQTNVSHDQTSKVLLTGQSMQPGIVGGTVKLMRSPHDVLGLALGDVLVTTELTPTIIGAFSRVSAIICDRGVQNPELMAQLKKQHIVCLINTHHATQTLKTGQRVIVDANAGKVLQAPTPLTQDSLQSVLIQPTVTKLYISAGNPDKSAEYVSNGVDGVGVLRSEYTFARFGNHPLAVIRGNQKSKLKAALHEVIAKYHSHDNKPVVYRSLNMTSAESRVLNHAEAFEPEESNPYLGFRGTLKMLRNLDLLNFELETIKEYLEKHKLPLGYMASFVRTPSELQLLHNHLKDYRLHQYSHYQFWLQLNTPENILAIDHYLMVPIDGFSVNVKSIHALLHGVDPDDPDIYSLYPLDPRMFEKLLGTLVQSVKKMPHPLRGTRSHPQVVMHLEDNNTQFVELAVRLGFTGITVKPTFVPTAKHWIRELEAAQIGK